MLEEIFEIVSSPIGHSQARHWLAPISVLDWLILIG